jgi:diguanylate cyclase (GGDEF)-like protein
MSDGQKRHRGAPLRTKPFSDAQGLREAMQRELRKTVSPSLVVLTGPDVGVRVKLERSIEIGRDPECELPLRDENVSWRHARVEDRGNGEWVAIDLGSTNGTVIDGQPCSEKPLRSGVRVFLGTTVIEFQEVDGLREGFNAEVERLLSIDELSGLWVRRRFDAQLQTSVAAVTAGSSPCLSVIVMDMDGVKGINDTHGHQMGAYVIGEAGHVIGRVLDERGFATRFGGDEFAAALPGVGKDDAIAVAEEIRRAVVDHVYQRGEVRVHPGMSCGVATILGGAADAAELFHAADQAMYRAKRAGKNRVST